MWSAVFLLFICASSLQIKAVSNEDEIGQIVNRDFTDEYVRSYILVGDDETCLPDTFENYIEQIENFAVRDSDTIVATYPKAGTTWMQEMVWLISNDLDYEGAKVLLELRFPFLELSAIYDFVLMESQAPYKLPEQVSHSIDYIKEQASPRFIKTHLPLSLLPREMRNGSKSPKIIYVMRNPKDVFVSYFHHGKLLDGWRASFLNFSKAFLAGKVLYGDYFKHVFSFLRRTNVLVVRFEDMKQDLPGVVRKVAGFLGKNLSEEQVPGLCEHLSFDAMKKNWAVNNEEMVGQIKLLHPDREGSFLRSGQVGQYKEAMTEEMNKEFDDWIDGSLKGSEFEGDAGYFKNLK